MTRIGLVVHNIHDEFSIELIKGADLFCSKNSCQLFILPVNAKNISAYGYEYRYQASMDFINSSNFDGLIFSGGSLSSFVTLDEYKEILDKIKSVPIVNITTDVKGYPYVTSDSQSAFKKIITHLITVHNCKKFILIKANDYSSDSVDRENLFYQVLKEHKIDFNPSNVLNGDFNRQKAVKVLDEYINKNGLDADAIVCLNDTMAVGVCELLSKKNIKIPQDIIVTGFDDKEQARYLNTNLTTVNQNIQQQAYKAAEVLMNIIQGKKVNHKNIIKGKEKIRCSCGCLPPSEIKTESINANGKKIRFNQKQLSYFMRELPQRFISQFYAIHYFLSDTREVSAFQEFLDNLPKHLERANIDAISICVYEKPVLHRPEEDFVIPNKVKRIVKFEKQYKNALNYEEVYFNPHEQILPKNTFFKNYQKLVVIPLFEKNYQYGYFVASIEADNYLFYEILCEFFAKEFTNALKINIFHEKNQELETAYTSLEQNALQLSYLSQTDELTQIMNRRGFLNNIAEVFSKNLSGMIIYCDMDGLKTINDTYGHEFGDKAIIAQSKILLNSCSAVDIVARFAGDEFVIAAINMDKEGFEKLKKSINNQCEYVNSNSNYKYKISISMGATSFGPGNYDLPILLAQADSELYKEKKLKKGK